MKKTGLIMPNKGLFYGYVAPLLTIILFVILMGVAIFNLYYRSKITDGELMAADIATLATIFENIDKECDILGFDAQKNPINFLTIKKDGFVGSQIGSMNVRNPGKWQGPYLPSNPEMQGVVYQIIRTQQGYFITPGEGVTLPSGKKIGTDIIFDENTDIELLLLDDKALLFNNKPLAAYINIGAMPQQLNSVVVEELAMAQEEWVKQHATKKGGARYAML